MAKSFFLKKNVPWRHEVAVLEQIKDKKPLFSILLRENRLRPNQSDIVHFIPPYKEPASTYVLMKLFDV